MPTSVMNLTDQLTTDPVEDSSKAIVTTCDNEIAR